VSGESERERGRGTEEGEERISLSPAKLTPPGKKTYNVSLRKSGGSMCGASGDAGNGARAISPPRDAFVAGN